MINYNALNNDLLFKMVKLVEFNKNSSLKNLIEEENKVDTKYKTELCKKFQSTGKCPYGHKCRFAQGKEELICKLQGLNYKKKPCKTFYFYLKYITFYHLEKTFIQIEVFFYMEGFQFLKVYRKKIYLMNRIKILEKLIPIIL